MDLIKKLTGKNPAEYEAVAKSLVDNSDVALFAKLVKQDDFLFDFVKNNVAKRIQLACTKDNYLNLLNFFEYYSSSYDNVFAEVLYKFGGIEILPVIKEIYVNGDDNKKAYATKFFSLVPNEYLEELLPLLRTSAKSSFEPLSINFIEVLAKMNDEVSKSEALNQLNSEDEFEKYKSSIKDEVNRARAKHAVYENQRTIKAVAALKDNDIETFGKLMNASHVSLRDDYETSCEEVDVLVEEAWKIDGVIGSRITGGGFGGCTVSIVKDEAIDEFKEKLAAAYEEKVKKTPEFYVVSIGDGPSRLI